MQNSYAPCPKCLKTDGEKIRFTWWGGIIGPKVLTHVKCRGCGHNYNGKSGKNNTAGIAIYSVIVGILIITWVFVMFAALGLLMFATR